MSNYYEYRDVKVMIAHRLMAMDGWKVYGYSADQSDIMTDYFHPAHWAGVAEKNGYVLCVDVYGKAEPQEIREYSNKSIVDYSIREKIEKLEAMTVERGATEAEEKTAREKIDALNKKSEEQRSEQEKYIVTGYIPGHMAHPPRCNWHIEKDGMIIAKGNGILKYSSLHYYTRSEDKATFESIKEGLKEHYSADRLDSAAQQTYDEILAKRKLYDQFDKLINKIDTVCGGLLGEGDGTVYEKVTVTEYKTEIKAVETETGSIKEGQCFILKCDFMYGKRKGFVYRIHRSEYNGKEYFDAYKLNRKKDKECTGSADQSNSWHCIGDNFMKWINQGAIAWCELQEVKTPYEVEKVVKKKVNNTAAKAEKKNSKKSANEPTTEINNAGYEFEIEASKHTKTNEPLWLVRIKDKLSRDEFIEIKRKFATLSGYYSKFTHSFIFKYDPTEKINELSAA